MACIFFLLRLGQISALHCRLLLLPLQLLKLLGYLLPLLLPLPRLLLDPQQMESVFTNLLLNARDAVGLGGRVVVSTELKDSWAVASIEDNGCGMSPDFVSRSLFRPFQTTKKKGMGIGMFQSKMIVEAHGGRIEVLTASGQGTTFRIHLPLMTEEREPAHETAFADRR